MLKKKRIILSIILIFLAAILSSWGFISKHYVASILQPWYGAESLINIRSEDELRRQIFYSKKVLESKLACPVNMFSYGEGFLNKHIKALVVEAGYKLAVSTKTGRCYSPRDIFALKRIRISESSGNLFYLFVKASGYNAFFKDNKKGCR